MSLAALFRRRNRVKDRLLDAEMKAKSQKWLKKYAEQHIK